MFATHFDVRNGRINGLENSLLYFVKTWKPRWSEKKGNKYRKCNLWFRQPLCLLQFLFSGKIWCFWHKNWRFFFGTKKDCGRLYFLCSVKRINGFVAQQVRAPHFYCGGPGLPDGFLCRDSAKFIQAWRCARCSLGSSPCGVVVMK